MKVITEYQCAICKRRWDTEEDALSCEARGVQDAVPVGCIHGNNRPGAFYDGIVFAVAACTVECHYRYLALWACRDAPIGVGDSLGKERCGSGGPARLTEHDAHVNRGMPAFRRMVEWLRSQGIEPTMWDGETAVPLEDD